MRVHSAESLPERIQLLPTLGVSGSLARLEQALSRTRDTCRTSRQAC